MLCAPRVQRVWNVEQESMIKKILMGIAVSLLALAYCPWSLADVGSVQEEFAALQKQAKKAGGASHLSKAQHQRFLELKYMIGSKYEKPLPAKEAQELARLEIASRKSGGLSRLPEEQYRRILALRIMRGDSYNQPLPSAEANELASLQVEAKKLGGESRLPGKARQRLKELRAKVCQGESGNPFF